MSIDHNLSKIELTGKVYLCRPVFVDKDTCVLSAFGSVIRKISTKTGESLGSFYGHNENITFIQVIHGNSSKVMTCSLDGYLILWDYNTMNEWKRLNLGAPIYDVIVPSSSSNNSKYIHEETSLSSTNVRNSVNPEYLNEELYLIMANDSNKKDVDNDSNSINNNNSSSNYSAKLVIFDLIKEKIRRKVSKIHYPRNSPTRSGIIAKVSFESSEYDWIITAINTHHSEMKKLSEQSELLLWSTELKSGFTISINQGQVTCLDYHSMSGVLIIGHESGEIVIYHDFQTWLQLNKSHAPIVKFEDKGKTNYVSSRVHTNTIPVQTILHWHAHPVYTLCFSSDGRCAYSGGEEGVLVKWYVSADSTHRKAFIPRLGGAISHISSSSTQSLAVLCLRDNSVRIVNFASLKQEWIVRSLSLTDESSSKNSSLTNHIRLLVEPRTGCLVCNSFPDSLQVLEAENLRVRAPYPILDYVRISRQNSNGKIYDPMITHFAFDGSMSRGEANLLITVDMRRGENLDSEYSLKFWCWSDQLNQYRLEAQMDSPHKTSAITCIAFCPENFINSQGSSTSSSLRQFVSASSDGFIKFWQRSIHSTSNSNRGSKISWVCAYSFKHRESPVTAMAFSYDGSVLAIAQGNVVYLWDPINVMLKTSLTLSQVSVFSNDPIVFLGFIEPHSERDAGYGSGEAILVIGTKHVLAVYNVLSLKLLWSKSGCYSNISIAHSGYQIPSSESNRTKDIWLAVASETIGSNHQDTIPGKINTNYTLELLDIYSSQTIASTPSNSRITSITFRPRNQSYGSAITPIAEGVFASTEYGDVFFFGNQRDSSRSDKFDPKSSRMVLAQISRKDNLPTIPFLLESTKVNVVSPPEVDLSPLSKATVADKNKIRDLFDPSSQNIPAISSIFDSFLKASSTTTVNTTFDLKLSKYTEVTNMDDVMLSKTLVDEDFIDDHSNENRMDDQNDNQNDDHQSQIIPNNLSNHIQSSSNLFYSGKVQQQFDSMLSEIFFPKVNSKIDILNKAQQQEHHLEPPHYLLPTKSSLNKKASIIKTVDKSGPVVTSVPNNDNHENNNDSSSSSSTKKLTKKRKVGASMNMDTDADIITALPTGFTGRVTRSRTDSVSSRSSRNAE